MQKITQVSWWKRLLLAFTTILICLTTYSAVFAVGVYVRSHEPHESFFKQGGAAQFGAEVFLLGGLFFALPCFFLIAAPLVLLVPVRLQLRRWYGMLLAAIVTFVLPLKFLGADDLASVRSKIQTLEWTEESFLALMAALPCALYLWLLRNQAKKPAAAHP